ncbi:g11094 [Coccomyxa viridis]|uniref:G11094 protein n=1 Tax=Coccomyxa viridis TaxID=1274662 RepID=A0ABP1G759_9CHLO
MKTFYRAVLSELINCGTYKSQPIFVVRHFQKMNASYAPLYIYSVHTCRLQEGNRKVQVSCVRLLRPMGEKLTLSAVAGDRLYLTSLLPPILGKLLSVDLTKDVDPEWTIQKAAPGVHRQVDTIVALGGHLYVYGGVRAMRDGTDTILSDVLVARAQGGVVKQPWRRLAIGTSKRLSSKRVPSISMAASIFGHESPEGRLSLYLFGGMRIKDGPTNE